MRRLNLLFLFLFLLSSKAESFVGIGEKINFKFLFKKDEIADVSAKNQIADYKYVALGRGTSDGVYENDHYTFQKNGKFAFRGVCVKADSFTSLWLSYHNFRPNSLVVNENFEGKKLSKRFIPKRVNNIVRINKVISEEVFGSFAESDQGAQFNDENAVFAGEDNEKIKVVDKEKLFEFNPNIDLEEIINASKNEVKYFSYNLAASPITFSRVPRTTDLGYSVSASCLICEGFTVDLSYSYTLSSEKPPKSEFSEGNAAKIRSSSNYNASVDFKVNDVIIDRLNYWVNLSWSRSRTADTFEGQPVFSPDFLWSGIPIGLSYNFIATDKIPEFSVNYGLQWDLEQVEFIGEEENSNGDYVPVKQVQSTQKTRHSIKFIFNWLPLEALSITNTFWYKPYHDFANKEFNWKDSGPFTNNFMISYTTSLDVSISYINDITWDKITNERDGTPSTNMVSSFELSYSFNF